MQDPMAVAMLGESDTAVRATDSPTQMHSISVSRLEADSQ
jgi:hypothetical protein